MKKFIIQNINLMSEWNWEENNILGLNPNILTYGSNKKAVWKCSNGHTWEDTITHRTNGRNCPYCSNHRLLKGYNDLGTKYPSLSKEWNYEKNTDCSPDSIFPFSNKQIWWICKKGHEWQDSPNHRISRNNGCPYCSNHRVLAGFNDLATTHPQLIKEWNFEKNGDLKPSQVLHGSQKKVWWKCVRNHEWKSTIASRANGVGCPNCKKELSTSFPEQSIYFYLKKLFPDAINRYLLDKKELDVFIPSVKIGVEYDGMAFHDEENRIKELEKDNFFFKQGITVYRVKESRDTESTIVKDNIIYFSPKYMYKNLEKVIYDLISIIYNHLNKKVPNLKLSIKEDQYIILESLLSTQKENSILTNPVLSKEWNYQKNKNVNPEYLTKGSGYKVWWICEKGHEWQSSINSRTRGNNCPYCSNQKILKGYNDLKTLMPKLAEQWHPTKNKDLSPEMVGCGSHNKVWWLCDKGHEWQAYVYSRTNGSRCPLCVKKNKSTKE